jgi:molybdopterin molybdotransferase
MITTQRLPAALTPLDTALAMLLDGLAPVEPIERPLAEARGGIAAPMPPLPARPAADTAAVDGYAFRARDLVGASSYAPLPLLQPPIWVEAGDVMPSDCDCVVDADGVDLSGAMAQVVAEAIPGQGVRRAGGDITGGSMLCAGRRLHALDLMMARAAGWRTLAVRRPRLHLINVPVRAAEVTAPLIAEFAQAAGAAVTRSDAAGRDVASIAEAFDIERCDLVVTIGGTGVGHNDAAVQALVARGTLKAHGIALAPGRTAAIGTLAGIPVIALPGAPGQALVAWWTLALPVLDLLAARQPRPLVKRPLARKIASSVGIAEIALLGRTEQGWMPLAAGELPLDAIARADGWLAVPADSEGFAAGTPVNAYLLRE